MREMHVPIITAAMAGALLMVPVHAQQSHWASADDKTAKYIIEMERKWAEGVCADNGVVASLIADDFQGTSTNGERFTKADELRDEKSPRIAHDCGLDEAKVRFVGDGVAVVYGSEHAVGKDQSHPNAKVCQVWTDTWLKRGGTCRSLPHMTIACNASSCSIPRLSFFWVCLVERQTEDALPEATRFRRPVRVEFRPPIQHTSATSIAYTR